MAKFTWTAIRTDGTVVPLTKDTSLVDTPIICCNGLAFEVGIPESGLPEQIEEILHRHNLVIGGIPVFARLPSNEELDKFMHFGQRKAYEIALFNFNCQDFEIQWYDFFTQENKDLTLGTVLPIYDLSDWQLRKDAMNVKEQIAKNKERILDERAKRFKEYGYVRLSEL